MIDTSHVMRMAIWKGYLERLTKANALREHHRRRDAVVRRLDKAYEAGDREKFDAVTLELRALDDDLYRTRHER